jgi:ABC-type Zn uptake system ZnuABC Zn-binding protein ZnuA
VVRRFALVLAVAVLAVACGGGGGSGQPSGSGNGAIRVVATTTVLADLVRSVAGDHATVISLVPAGGDVHTFSPRPDTIRAVADAQLIVMNGLGLDDWLLPTISSVNATAPVVQLGVNLPGFVPLPDEDPETANPHLWMDVTYARGYVERIADALVAVDPGNAADYRANEAAKDADLVALDGWIHQQVDSVPPAQRRVVTFHDAFPYFARAYGLDLVGVAVESPGQDPSAGEIAALITAIRSADVKVILAENQFPRSLADELASETGATVVANLYDDSLGDPPVTSYDALMRWDVSQVVDALR